MVERCGALKINVPEGTLETADEAGEEGLGAAPGAAKRDKVEAREREEDPSLAIMPQMMKNMVAKLSRRRRYSNI